jgi:hypothetical protein
MSFADVSVAIAYRKPSSSCTIRDDDMPR